MAAKKNSTTVAAQTTQTTVISSTKVALKHLNNALDNLGKVTIGLDAFMDDDVEITLTELMETTFIIESSVENHASTVVSKKKTSGIDAKTDVGEVTIDVLTTSLKQSVKILQNIERFGNTQLTIRNMKSIRVDAQRVDDLAEKVYIASEMYQIRN